MLRGNKILKIFSDKNDLMLGVRKLKLYMNLVLVFFLVGGSRWIDQDVQVSELDESAKAWVMGDKSIIFKAKILSHKSHVYS